MNTVTVTPLANPVGALAASGFGFIDAPPGALAVTVDLAQGPAGYWVVAGRLVLALDAEAPAYYLAATPKHAVAVAVRCALGYAGLSGDAEVMTEYPWAEAGSLDPTGDVFTLDESAYAGA